jgi:hypothetical protein
MPPVTYALGVKDELGTPELGKFYTDRGFNRYGNFVRKGYIVFGSSRSF